MMTTTARKEAEHEEDNGAGGDVDGSNGDEGDGGSADVFVKTPRSWTMRAPAPPALVSLQADEPAGRATPGLLGGALRSICAASGTRPGAAVFCLILARSKLDPCLIRLNPSLIPRIQA